MNIFSVQHTSRFSHNSTTVFAACAVARTPFACYLAEGFEHADTRLYAERHRAGFEAALADNKAGAPQDPDEHPSNESSIALEHLA